MPPVPDHRYDKEQVEALFDGRPPERIPMGNGGMGSRFKIVAGHTMAEFYRNPATSFQASLEAGEAYGWNRYIDCPIHTLL
jgi:hypothetical protein